MKKSVQGLFSDCGAFAITSIVCYSWGHWIGGTIALVMLFVVSWFEDK